MQEVPIEPRIDKLTVTIQPDPCPEEAINSAFVLDRYPIAFRTAL